jgi:hypothetical protein
MMMRLLGLVSLAVAVVLAGCQPPDAKNATPDERPIKAEPDSQTGLGDLEDEFKDLQVDGGSSASAQRGGISAPQAEAEPAGEAEPEADGEAMLRDLDGLVKDLRDLRSEGV